MKYPKLYEVIKSNQVDNETMVSVKEYYDGVPEVFGFWHSKEIAELFNCNIAEIRYSPGINQIYLRLSVDYHLPRQKGVKEHEIPD